MGLSYQGGWGLIPDMGEMHVEVVVGGLIVHIHTQLVVSHTIYGTDGALLEMKKRNSKNVSLLLYTTIVPSAIQILPYNDMDLNLNTRCIKTVLMTHCWITTTDVGNLARIYWGLCLNTTAHELNNDTMIQNGMTDKCALLLIHVCALLLIHVAAIAAHCAYDIIHYLQPNTCNAHPIRITDIVYWYGTHACS